MQWAQKQKGFTIVELLIVVVVIAILAAITIVSYNGITNRSYDTSVQSDMATIAKKMELQKAESSLDIYPPTNTDMNFVVPVNKSAYTTSGLTFNLLVCYPSTASPKTFMLLATSKSGARYTIENGGGVQPYTGGVNWTGGDGTAICNAMKSGWVATAAGYRSNEGPWRAWAGGN